MFHLQVLKKYLFDFLVNASLITNFTNIRIFNLFYKKILIQAIFHRNFFIRLRASDDVYSNNFSLKILCYKFHKYKDQYVCAYAFLGYLREKQICYKYHKHEVFHLYEPGDVFLGRIFVKILCFKSTNMRLFTCMRKDMIL